MAYSPNARLQDGYDRGSAAWSPGAVRPVEGSAGFESSNLTNAWMAGWNAKQAAWEASQRGSSRPTAPTVTPAPAPAPSTPTASIPSTGLLPGLLPPKAPKTPAPVAPKLPKLPSLQMSKGSSVVNQLRDLQSTDSVLMQQAKIGAQELGAASGAIHSSQQAGAAQRAVQNALTPLAQAEAERVAGQDIANWSTRVKRLTDTYDKQYTGYLAKLNITSSEKQAMMAASTSLSESLMSSINSLLNNPDIEFGEEVKNKITSIYNSALRNNNTILDMGFTYA